MKGSLRKNKKYLRFLYHIYLIRIGESEKVNPKIVKTSTIERMEIIQYLRNNDYWYYLLDRTPTITVKARKLLAKCGYFKKHTN